MDGRRPGGSQDWQNKEDQVWKEYCEFMVGRVDFEVPLVGLSSMLWTYVALSQRCKVEGWQG